MEKIVIVEKVKDNYYCIDFDKFVAGKQCLVKYSNTDLLKFKIIGQNMCNLDDDFKLLCYARVIDKEHIIIKYFDNNFKIYIARAKDDSKFVRIMTKIGSSLETYIFKPDEYCDFVEGDISLDIYKGKYGKKILERGIEKKVSTFIDLLSIRRNFIPFGDKLRVSVDIGKEILTFKLDLARGTVDVSNARIEGCNI